MIDGSKKKHSRQLAFELHNWHLCEKRSNLEKLAKRQKDSKE